MLSLVVWLVWASQNGKKLDQSLKESANSHSEREVVYILWATPLIVSVSFTAFSLMVFLRVSLDSSYTHSSYIREWADRSATMSVGVEDLLKDSANKPRGSHITKSDMLFAEIKKKMKEESGSNHAARLVQLSNILKYVMCSLLLMLGGLYVTFQLVAADSHIAVLVQGFLAAIFLLGMAFVQMSFRHLWEYISDEIFELPLWKKVSEAVQSNWMRACFIGIFLPAMPFVLLLSVCTQCVRRCRGISKTERYYEGRIALAVGDAMGVQPSEDCRPAKVPILTDRIHRYLDAMMHWNGIAILWWLYFFSYLFVALTVSPRLLNVFLAFLTDLLGDTDFVLVCCAVFILGMFLFLLPVVPGAPIFFFGGALLPEVAKKDWGESGFWWGALISILLGWILKLSACAMQQKCIGEMLGHSLNVRQCVGVHKPFIRTIEAVLRKPGLSIGKVSILCGGPDWPTSVLAGILRCSLLQMLLGTTPIIFFVAPFALSGAFYLKRDEGEFWSRSANLMFTLTTAVCVILWAIMAWAWEAEFEKSREQVSAGREEDIELHWKDHCSSCRSSRIEVCWNVVPRLVTIPYLVGALSLVMVGHGFWWQTHRCFGDFAATDDIDDLKWYGTEEAVIFKFYGLVGMIVTAASSLGLVIFKLYVRCSTWQRLQELLTELREQEEQWKANRLEAIRKENRKSGKAGDMEAGNSQGLSVVQADNSQGLHTDEAGLSVAEQSTEQNLGIARAEAASADIPHTPTVPNSTEPGDKTMAQESVSLPPSSSATTEPGLPDANTQSGQHKPAPEESSRTKLPHEVGSPNHSPRTSSPG
jgi:hypothetical protein